MGPVYRADNEHALVKDGAGQGDAPDVAAAEIGTPQRIQIANGYLVAEIIADGGTTGYKTLT